MKSVLTSLQQSVHALLRDQPRLVSIPLLSRAPDLEFLTRYPAFIQSSMAIFLAPPLPLKRFSSPSHRNYYLVGLEISIVENIIVSSIINRAPAAAELIDSILKNKVFNLNEINRRVSLVSPNRWKVRENFSNGEFYSINLIYECKIAI